MKGLKHLLRVAGQQAKSQPDVLSDLEVLFIFIHINAVLHQVLVLLLLEDQVLPGFGGKGAALDDEEPVGDHEIDVGQNDCDWLHHVPR